jgi:flagellar hook assembly protein FlgD
MTRSYAARHPRLSRALTTTFVAVVALLIVVWVAPRASGAAAAWISTPPVRLHALTPPGDGSLTVAGPTTRGAGAPVTLDAGTTFTMAAVVCDVPAAGSVNIRLRTSRDGGSWGSWFTAPLEVVDENQTSQAFIDPIWTGAGRYVQVRADGSTGRGPSTLTGVRLITIDPTGEAGLVASASGAVRRVAAAVAGVTLTDTASAAATTPAIVPRSGWGADESLRSGSPSYAPLKVAFVHHTASGNDYSQADAPGIVRAIYAFHTKTLHWSDIGYNFLIDRYGTIYEGRYGGIARGVIGAQAGGFNTGSAGISVLGTFIDQTPPAAAVTALERLLAWKLSVAALDPTGTSTLTCGLTDKYVNGAKVTFPAIAGHRQANYTECPGDSFYALLPAIRANVAKRVGASLKATLSASDPLISPNGDGALDSTHFAVGITTSADWRLTVRDAGGQSFASWSGEGASASVAWDGTSGGRTVPDGTYTAEVAVTAADGSTAAASAQITVDTTAPRLTGAAAPGWFSPDGDGQTESAAVTYAPAEACAVRVGILDADGDVVRWLHGWRTREVRSYSVTWDGKVGSGNSLKAAADGPYRFDVERRDAAGNIARQGVKVAVDRTVGYPSALPGTFSPGDDGARDTTALGFKLTRKATVTVRIVVGGDLVRTLSLGTLAAGTHSATWDGRAGSGEYLVSSRPAYTVTAVSALGESSVSKPVVVDLYRPRLYAATGKATTAGTGTKLSYKAVDPFSAKVDVSYAITDAKGRRVASGHPGWQPTGQSLVTTWKPASRGVYTVTYSAVDLGGNHEAATARTTVTVR